MPRLRVVEVCILFPKMWGPSGMMNTSARSRRFGLPALAMSASSLMMVGCVSPVQRAAVRGDVEQLTSLIKTQAELDRCATCEHPDGGSADTSPLGCAAWMGRLEAMETLIRRGADVNATACFFAPIALAADRSHLAAVKRLIAAGADVNRQTPKQGSTPIFEAKDCAIARLLLDAGADPTQKDGFGLTAAQRARQEGWSQVADLLEARTSTAVKEAAHVDIAERIPIPDTPRSQATVPKASETGLPALMLPKYRLPPQPNDFALVVGVEDYSELPAALYAERDAQAFRAHVEALGVPPRNIVSLTGAKAGRAGLDKYLEDWLPKMARVDSRIYFFFSGHGAPDPTSGEAYLMPWDADPNYLDRTAYSLGRLYANLGKTKAREIFVALDTCFSGAGGRSVLPKGARPLVTKIATPVLPRSLTVLTASDSNEISSTLDEKGHGAFTYFLLEGLNQQGAGISASQLYSYLSPLVQDEARRMNRQQTPQLRGDGKLRLR